MSEEKRVDLIAAYPGEYRPTPRSIPGVLWVDDNQWADHVVVGPDKLDSKAVAQFLMEVSCLNLGAPIVPLRDAVVVPTGWANDNAQTGGLSYLAAISAEHRLYFRERLEQSMARYLNPRWSRSHQSFRRWPIVVKQAGSSYSEGVRVCHSFDEVANAHQESEATRVLSEFAPVHAFVYEDFLEGTHYEVSGCVADRERFLVFGDLEQSWDRPGGKILAYKPVEDRGMAQRLKSAAKEVVRALGLRWCCFNIEFIWTDDIGLTVIECNARFGWDPSPYWDLVYPVYGGTQLDEVGIWWLAARRREKEKTDE